MPDLVNLLRVRIERILTDLANKGILNLKIPEREEV